MENSSSITPYEKLDGIARWLGSGVATAFFASLERCSCVNLTTYDTDDDNDEEAKDRPLMFTNLKSSSVSSSTTAATSVDNLPV